MTTIVNEQSDKAHQTRDGCCCGSRSNVSTDKAQPDTARPEQHNVDTDPVKIERPRSCCGGT